MIAAVVIAGWISCGLVVAYAATPSFASRGRSRLDAGDYAPVILVSVLTWPLIAVVGLAWLVGRAMEWIGDHS